MKIIVHLYNSQDISDEAYWNVQKTSEQYGVSIIDTNKVDWGGQNIYEVVGSEKDLTHFAIDFCGEESLNDLELVN